MRVKNIMDFLLQIWIFLCFLREYSKFQVSRAFGSLAMGVCKSQDIRFLQAFRKI